MKSILNFSSALNLAIRGNLLFFVVNYSETVLTICRSLLTKGFIRSYQVSNLKKPNKSPTRFIKIELAYFESRPVLKQFVNVSKPGRRVYASSKIFRILLGRLQSKRIFYLNRFLFFFHTTKGLQCAVDLPSNLIPFNQVSFNRRYSGEFLGYAVI